MSSIKSIGYIKLYGKTQRKVKMHFWNFTVCCEDEAIISTLQSFHLGGDADDLLETMPYIKTESRESI